MAYPCSGPMGSPGHDSVEVYDAGTESGLGVMHGLLMVGSDPAISGDGRSSLCLRNCPGCTQSPESAAHASLGSHGLLPVAWNRVTNRVGDLPSVMTDK